MDNRSEQYNWFKGKDNQPEKTSWKQRGKGAFKWAKIGMYVGLFGITATGCVQTIAVKAEAGAIDRGTEFYASDSEISPRIYNFNLHDKIIVNSEDENDTYPATTISIEESKIWVNVHEDKDLLKEMNTIVTGEDGYDVEKMAAWGGDLTSFRFYDVDNEFDETEWDDLIGNNVQDHDAKAFGSLVDGAVGSSVSIYSTEYRSKTSSSKDYYIVSQLTAFEEDEDGNTTSTPTFGSSKIEVKTQDSSSELNNGRTNMAISHLDALMETKLVSDEYIFETQAEADAAALKFSNDMSDKSFGDEFIEIVFQSKYSATYSYILPSIGIHAYADNDNGDSKKVDWDAIADSYEYTSSSMILGSSSTNWKPMVTWSDAWRLGPFYGMFAYPIGVLSASMLSGLGLNAGWNSILTIIVVVIILRLIAFALTFKGTLQQQKMTELNAKKAQIEAKYVKYEGNKQMDTRKRQEIQQMYKKNGVNPMGSLTSMFVSMPIFLAVWRVISGLVHLKSASWLGIVFADTSYKELLAGQWQYLLLIVLAAGIQLLSQLFPKWLNRRRDKNRMNTQQKAALKKGEKTQRIMMFVMVFMAVIFSAGIQIYWIIGGLWQLFQAWLTHKILKRQKSKK